MEQKGWTPARELRIGDVLVSHDGQRILVEGVADSGRVETVYNVEVEEYHTYFVGCDDWGFSLWAHNAPYEYRGVEQAAEDFANGTVNEKQLKKAGVPAAEIAEIKARAQEFLAAAADMDYEDALLGETVDDTHHEAEFYGQTEGLQERYDRDVHYPNSPTQADRNALGAGPGQVVDHDPPLVVRYYDGDPAIGELPGRLMTPEERATSAADRSRMRLQAKKASDQQGQMLKVWAEQRARELGL